MLQLQDNTPERPDLAPFQHLGRELSMIRGEINLAEATADPNRAAIEQQFYASGETELPVFTYPDTSARAESLDRALGMLRIPPGPPEIRELYAEKMTEIALFVRAFDAVGSGAELANITGLIYDHPSVKTIEAATEILQQPEATLLQPADMSRDDLKAAYEQALEDAGLKGQWVVQLGTAPMSYVEPENQLVSVGLQRNYTPDNVARLVYHEIQGHVFRAANGYTAHPAIAPLLATGLAGYDTTEEGVAVYAEHASGLLSDQILRTYAARALAVQSLLEGANFVETYHLLRQHGVRQHGAFKNTLRAHRGGGTVRDHIYLQGYLDVKQFVERGGDLRILYTGKIAPEHIDHVERLKAAGLVRNEPAHLPDFLRGR
jgi:uncharacterized protein (TIGR02421 family)